MLNSKLLLDAKDGILVIHLEHFQDLIDFVGIGQVATLSYYNDIQLKVKRKELTL